MVELFTDSCGDSNAEQIAERCLHVIPLYVNFNDQTYLDGVTITPPQFFDLVKQTGFLPKTSARSIPPVAAQFAQADEAVQFGISSVLSASIQNALLAKTELDRSEIYVVDSLTPSSAIGLLTDTLDYLYMVGRCGSMSHLIGSVLKIRPIIEVNKNGTLGIKTKVGGSRKKALNSLLDNFKANVDNIDMQRVFITHTYCDDDAHELKEELLKIAPIEEVCITCAGATIACHCGPNTIGILYFNK